MRRRNTTLQLKADGSLAVMLIDMQEKFINQLARTTIPRLIRAQKKVIKRCAEKDVPVIVYEYGREGPTVDALKKDLDAVPRTVFMTKIADDAFSDPELPARLRELGVEKLLLAGINATSCVFDTADSAKKTYGYEVYMANNLTADWYGESGWQKSWWQYEDMGIPFYPEVEII